MSSESMIEAARAYVEAFNRADWERIETGLAPGAVYDEVGTGRRADGREEILGLFKGWKATMPDAVGTVTSAVASGSDVVLEITWRGTMSGPWGDIAPTGKQQTTRAAWVISFDGDTISGSRQYFDSLSLLQQLGVMPEPASA